MELTEQQKLEILCAYLPYGVEFKLPIKSCRFDSITEGESWRLGMTIQDAIKDDIYNASQYERMTLKQINPSIMWEDGEIFLGQMISSLGFEEDDVFLNEVKLILRHPDDMTEEEQATYIELWESDSNFIKCATDCLRYLHSIHIDTFGAIEGEFAVRKETN